MIGIVIVSHSARLAEGVCELAAQMAQGRVRLAPAGGTADPANPLGTDAMKVLAAIKEVYSEDGVVVFTDLGSAVLSAETALELLDERKRQRVHLCSAPVVEGAVAAAAQAAAGASLAEVLRDAQGRESPPAAAPPAFAEERLATLPNPLGLHARPAAQFIRLARRFRARVTLANLSTGSAETDAASIHGVLGLGARQGHQLRLRAEGPDAREALDALAAFVESGCGEGEATAEAPVLAAPGAGAEGQWSGIPASEGIAFGPLAHFHPPELTVTARTIDDPESEGRRLDAAIRSAQQETRALYEWARSHVGAPRAGIFDAQALLLEDPALAETAARLVRERGLNAEFAWQTASGEAAARLAALEDPYLRTRAADVTDAAGRVLRNLAGGETAAPALGEPAILAARDLTPSHVRDLDPARVLGLCLETGSASAHSVILARAMGIPAVAGLGPGLAAIPEGALVALDGARGAVWVAPSAEQARELTVRREEWLGARAAAQAGRRTPAATRDGRRIRVFANINSVAGAVEAVEYGAEGVGVLRTEFLFLGRSSAPGEEEQFAAYLAIASALGGRPLVIRTLDAGGDKSLPYIETGPEANPFLGWRGIRVTLDRRDLLRTQLRAILRAGRQHPVEVLLPMLSTLAELRVAKALVAEVEAELGCAGTKVGVMIETPAAAAIADQLAREASFLSIGSNDLIQYVMAADRTNARVAPLADPYQPAVLRLIRQTIAAGRAAGAAVALCGELAADTLATPLLLGLGLEEFSVSAPLVPEVKRAIRCWSLPEAEAIARQALDLDSSDAVRRLLAGLRPDPPA